MAATTSKPKCEENKLIDYHCQCGYTNFRTIFLMSKIGILPPIKEQQDYTNNICQTYMKDKMTWMAIPKQSNTETRKLGELVQSNLCNLMRTCSIKDNTYIVTYLDNKTRWIHLGFLSKKSQQLKEFKAYQVAFERQRGIMVRCLRTNKGCKYASREIQEYLKEQEIK